MVELAPLAWLAGLIGAGVATKVLVDRARASARAKESHVLAPAELAALAELPNWTARVEALETMGALRTHVWLGFTHPGGAGVLVPKELLRHHAYIGGAPGSGKTSRGILPLALQLVHFERESPIVVIDLKGDPALFHALRSAAAKTKRDFRFFTLEQDKATHAFNPFGGAEFRAASIKERCELVMQSLDLNHGPGYGRQYYTNQARGALYAALQDARRTLGRDAASFEEVRERLDELPSWRKREASQLLSEVEWLSGFRQLNVRDDAGEERKEIRDAAISMSRVIERGEIVYFWLPTLFSPISTREVAELAVYALVTAAMRAKGPARHTYLFIDEFQVAAGANFEHVLNQARRARVSAILTSQTVSTLRKPDIDLWPIVWGTTRYRQFFTALEEQLREQLVAFSGTYVRWDPSESVGPGAQRRLNLSPKDAPVIDHNALNFLNQYSNLSLVHVIQDEGLTPLGPIPTLVRTEFTEERKEHEAAEALPWPEPNGVEGTFLAREDPREQDVKYDEAQQNARARLRGETERVGRKRRGPRQTRDAGPREEP